MKKLALLALMGTLAWSVDFSQLSTDELMKLRGTVAPSERPAFRAEMQKRIQSMSPEQRQQMMNSRGMGKGQGRGQGMQNRPTFATYDLNKDGKITAKEFEDARNTRRVTKANQGKLLRNAGTAPTFESIDSDGNGFVSQEEFSAHQAKRMNQRLK